MTYIWSVLIIISIVFSLLFGDIEGLNKIILTTSYDTLKSYGLVASNIILWSGILEVCVSSGMMKYFSFIIKPIIKKLFQTKNEETLDFISANITCNILSLGSAATPFGIEAMKNLEKENKNKGKESKDMATLVIINVCGFSLMPTSLMSLRMSYDTLNNSVVLFYIIVISFVTTIIMLTINLVGRKCI